MPISVSFRGPMLFVTKDASRPEQHDVVDLVIIPDASKAGEHADGTEARPHTAGLLLHKPVGVDEFIMLKGKTVIITATGESGRPTVDNAYLTIAPLHDMANPPGTKAANRVSRKLHDLPLATTLFMVGGKMSAEKPSAFPVEVPRHLAPPGPPQPIPLLAIWRSGAASGAILIVGTDGDIREIPLDGTVQPFFFNADKPAPSRLELTAPLLAPAVADQDNDFKWLYQLLVPPGDGSWKTWLGADQFLPAPRAVGFNPVAVKASPVHFPGTDTCDRARFRGV